MKFAVGRPWTLAATMERPRGDRVLADHGARRELRSRWPRASPSWSSSMRRRLPDIDPAGPAGRAAAARGAGRSMPTASGFSRHRAVDEQQVSETFSYLIDQVASTGVAAQMSVHCCASGVPIELLHRAGFSVLFLDLDQLSGADWDSIAERLEDGLLLGAGALPTRRP